MPAPTSPNAGGVTNTNTKTDISSDHFNFKNGTDTFHFVSQQQFEGDTYSLNNKYAQNSNHRQYNESTAYEDGSYTRDSHGNRVYNDSHQGENVKVESSYINGDGGVTTEVVHYNSHPQNYDVIQVDTTIG